MQPLYKRIPTWTSYILGNLLTLDRLTCLFIEGPKLLIYSSLQGNCGEI